MRKTLWCLVLASSLSCCLFAGCEPSHLPQHLLDEHVPDLPCCPDDKAPERYQNMLVFFDEEGNFIRVHESFPVIITQRYTGELPPLPNAKEARCEN